MAKQSEVQFDPRYKKVHNAGFVGLVDHMGSDAAICQAARVSYGQGTKSSSEDRALIRYLLRHRHTTPFEMCEVKFHIKLPIFVMRQLIRHRTANVNEYSGRYSEMVDEFYTPEMDYIQAQSKTNKQGREGEISKIGKMDILGNMTDLAEVAYANYQDMITPYEGDDPGLEATMGQQFVPSYPGLTKELARIILPVSNYTECYWKIDLHNLFHLLGLRLDPHAQREIRDFAQAMYDLTAPLFPLACEAFDDYVMGAKTFSRMEVELLLKVINRKCPEGENCRLSSHFDKIREMAAELGMTKRESEEFIQFITNK